MSERRSQRGFTLIELMISLVLFSFAIAGVLSVAVSMSQGFREQRAAVGAEGSVRTPLDFIGDALRQVSPGSPTGNIQDVGITPCPVANVLLVTNNQTSLVGGYTGWDQLELLYASGAVVTGSRAVYDVGTTTLDVDDTTGFVANDYVVISNTAIGTFVKITAINSPTQLQLAVQCTGGAALTIPTGGYPPGAIVIRAQHAIFTINDQDNIPTLFMDPDAAGPLAAEPLAEGIEDMQFALGFDTTAVPVGCVGCTANDNKVTEVGLAASDDEWQGNFLGDASLVANNILRAVRVTLISRTTSGIQGNATPFNRPGAEDHAAAIVFDQFRRRTLKTMVEIRNLAGSP